MENSSERNAQDVNPDADERQRRFDAVMERLEPHMEDLLWQGSMVRKFPKRQDSPRVLQFRLYYTGDRSERQRRLYVGPRWLADMLMDEIWRRRERAKTRYRPENEPWRQKRSGVEGMSLDELLRMLRGEAVPAPVLQPPTCQRQARVQWLRRLPASHGGPQR